MSEKIKETPPAAAVEDHSDDIFVHHHESGTGAFSSGEESTTTATKNTNQLSGVDSSGSHYSPCSSPVITKEHYGSPAFSKKKKNAADDDIQAGQTSDLIRTTTTTTNNNNNLTRTTATTTKAKASIWRRFLQNCAELPEWSIGGSKLSGRALNNAIGFIASCAFLMFGYDQGVLSALLTLDTFQLQIPLMTPRTTTNPICWLDYPESTIPSPDNCTGTPNTQAFGVAIYQIGCFFGAILILFYGESWGRKPSTFWGSGIMILGTVMQVSSFEYGLFLAGRVVGGVGNGMVTSTIPTWQSECARPEKRGFLIMLSGCFITCGIMIAYWVDYGFFFLSGGVRWRFPMAFQSAFTIIVMLGLLYLPDSPRWLVMRGRKEEAGEVIARLMGKGRDDVEVRQELENVVEGLEIQNKGGEFRMGELFTGGPAQNFRRTMVGVAAQFFQQICGINLITYYATYLFETSLGFDAGMSRLLGAANGTEYFLASLVALPLIERVGRRPLMLAGAMGMSASMAILAGTISTGQVTETGAPLLSPLYGITATVFLFVFNSFFAVGWLGMTWLYPAEITNLRIRIQANALSTCSNWIANFLIVMITPPAFSNLGYQTYIIFAVLCAAIVPCVYFFFPEPKGRSLEELDIIFASANKDGVSPVKRSLTMEPIPANRVEAELAKYFEGDDLEARRRSVGSVLGR